MVVRIGHVGLLFSDAWCRVASMIVNCLVEMELMADGKLVDLDQSVNWLLLLCASIIREADGTMF